MHQRTREPQASERPRPASLCLSPSLADGFMGAASIWKGRVHVGREGQLLSQGVSAGGLRPDPHLAAMGRPGWSVPARDVLLVPCPQPWGKARPKCSSPRLLAPVSSHETHQSWGGVVPSSPWAPGCAQALHPFLPKFPGLQSGNEATTPLGLLRARVAVELALCDWKAMSTWWLGFC